ncbi:MAG: nucleoside triphosphate pyrophosphohydrolase family protein [Synergistaceae bacterium]|jgi:predicted HAD superfamily Cof-like phosphohydrolase|nr:nucleoside triphosphate pyrophosphohydrolase family protein [Synergistaceae bacterium]
MGNSFIEGVTKFHETYGAAIGLKLEKGKEEEFLNCLKLRISLIQEETDEFGRAGDAFIEAHKRGDAETQKKQAMGMIDGITDLLYVVVGAAVAFGIDLETAFERVQESNMSKLGADGRPIYREDGKVLKGPGFHEPKLSDLVREENGEVCFTGCHAS